MSARPAMAPTTMPAMAPTEREEELDEDVGVSVLLRGTEDVMPEAECVAAVDDGDDDVLVAKSFAVSTASVVACLSAALREEKVAFMRAAVMFTKGFVEVVQQMLIWPGAISFHQCRYSSAATTDMISTYLLSACIPLYPGVSMHTLHHLYTKTWGCNSPVLETAEGIASTGAADCTGRSTVRSSCPADLLLTSGIAA